MTAELDPWRDAVRRAGSAVGLIELPSTRYIELSAHARELVGKESENGLDVLTSQERIEAAAVTGAAAVGVIDGTEVRRRHWRRTDGSVIEVTVRGRVIRLESAKVGLWVARELSRTSLGSLSGLLDEGVGFTAVGCASDALAVVTLDDGWRVREVAGDVVVLDDVLHKGMALIAATHPDDIARLLFAFAGATTRADAATRLRLVSGEQVVVMDTEVTRLGDGSWRLDVATVRDTRSVTELARDLQRIAIELQDAGASAGSATALDVLRIPGVSALSERQREIVVRLAAGERVATIAAEMYLSPPTVRNHLSAVFTKFGVHSQAELLAVLRGDRRGR